MIVNKFCHICFHEDPFKIDIEDFLPAKDKCNCKECLTCKDCYFLALERTLFYWESYGIKYDRNRRRRTL